MFGFLKYNPQIATQKYKKHNDMENKLQKLGKNKLIC